MKRAILVVLAGCILGSQDVLAQTVTVSGAGSSSMNGDYTPCGSIDGRTKYCESGTDNVIYWYTNQWIIAVQIGSASYSTRYNNYNDLPKPPETGWQTDGGAPPPPTLSGDVSHVPVPRTFIIDSTDDHVDINPGDGTCWTVQFECTLRAAIMEANALHSEDPVTIEFNITTGASSDAAWLFTPSPDALPAIERPVTIDASTQPGAVCRTLNDGQQHTLWVKVDGGGVLPGVSGLTINAGADGTIIRGLVMTNHGQAGIQSFADNVTIACSYLGVHEYGTIDEGNGTHGVRFREGSGSVLSNSLVSGNEWSGVRIETGASDTWLKGNVIGAKPISYAALPNDRAGVTDTGQRSAIGGTPAGASEEYGNVIAHNLLDGIRLTDNQTTTAIVGNRIFANGELGIDLNDDGVTGNDFKDIDWGPNGLQNYLHGFFPVYLGGNMITVYLTLYSEPGKQYLVEIFEVDSADPSGHGEGDTPLSNTTMLTNSNGYAYKVVGVSRQGGWSASTVLSSKTTRIDFDRYGSTSEFTAARTVTGPNVWLSGKVFLEGPYEGGGVMGTTSAFLDDIPGFHPFWESRYNGSHLNYDGWDAVANIPTGVVDWVLITLRQVNPETPPAPGPIETQKAAFVGTDGTLLDLDGSEGVGLYAPSGPDWYWIEIGHRNHIGIVSSFAVQFSPTATYDFTTSMGQAYGGLDAPMKNLGSGPSGPFGMFACETNLDETAQSLDFNRIVAAAAAGNSGYVTEDCTLDGQVDSDDLNKLIPNIVLGASSQIP